MEDNKTGSYLQEIKSQAKQSYILVSLGKVPDTFFCQKNFKKCYKLFNLSYYFSIFKWGCFLGLSCPRFTTVY